MEELIIELTSIQRQIDTIKNIISKLDPIKNCLLCDHWSKTDNYCGKFKAVPPPRVIIETCHDFINEIPF